MSLYSNKIRKNNRINRFQNRIIKQLLFILNKNYNGVIMKLNSRMLFLHRRPMNKRFHLLTVLSTLVIFYYLHFLLKYYSSRSPLLYARNPASFFFKGHSFIVSKCQNGCSNHGICNEELGRCDCFPGYDGLLCTNYNSNPNLISITNENVNLSIHPNENTNSINNPTETSKINTNDTSFENVIANASQSSNHSSKKHKSSKHLIVQRRNCSTDCGLHGTCNEYSGICECPIGFSGPDCSTYAMPSCHFDNNYLTPCNHPSSCSCTLECYSHYFNYRPFCYNDVYENGTIETNFDKVVLNPLVMLVAKPGGEEVMRFETGSVFENVPVSSHLCPLNCSNRGMCFRKNNGLHVCSCSGIYNGDGCEVIGDQTPFVCYNDCNRKGECIEGYCKCEKGYFGMDCSTFIDSNNQLKLVPRPPLLWGLDDTFVSNEPEDGDDLSPLIYVYDLHGQYHTWHQTQTNQINRLEHMLFLERLLASPHRTPDPEKADYFFLPLIFGEAEYYKHDVIQTVIDHISRTYPYWNRSYGHDHLLLTNDDWGICDIHFRTGFADPLVENMTILSQWGFTFNMEFKHTHPCFRKGKDVVIPRAYPKFEYGMIAYVFPKLYEGTNRTTLLYFYGSPAVGGSKSSARYVYSDGIRQKVYTLYNSSNKEDAIRMVDMHAFREDHFTGLRNSIFCFAPSGWGWGFRMTEAVLLGCIPVIIQPHILQPFEDDLLDWSKFSIRLSVDDIPNLRTILESITEAERQTIRRGMEEVWPRFVWTSPQFDIFHMLDKDQQKHYAKIFLEKDAFASIMQILGSRLNQFGSHSEPKPSALDRYRGKCSKACFAHGSCNEDVGRCDCDVGYKGVDCMENSACRGEEGYYPPCSFPSSCACAFECEELMLHRANVCYGDSKPKGEVGLGIDVVFNASRFVLTMSEKESGVRKEKLEEKEKGDEFPVHPRNCMRGCSGRGGCMWKKTYYACQCSDLFTGWGCEQKENEATAVNPNPNPVCLTDCSDHGECINGVCKCTVGYYGMDCSLFKDEYGVTQIIERPPLLWRNLEPKEEIRKLKIYVYELPGYMNTWQFYHTPRHYPKEPILFLDRLLSSSVRTSDPSQADYFFIPLILINRMKTYKSKLLNKAIEYISEEWPYWDRSKGMDHILLVNEPLGSCELDTLGFSPNLIENVTVLSLWGLTTNLQFEPNQPCFRPNRDILLPPSVPIQTYGHVPYLKLPTYLHPERTQLMYFYGHDASDERPKELEYEWSFGVVKTVWRLYKDTEAESGIRLVDDRLGNEDVHEGMLRSVFCLAPAGSGWETWTAEAVLLGCIPIIIQPDVIQPFEGDLLDWSKFSLRVQIKDVSNLSTILKSVSAEEVRTLQSGLAEVWTRFVWPTHLYNPFYYLDDWSEISSLLVRKDAFASVLEILEKRLIHVVK